MSSLNKDGARDATYWRSFDEQANTPQFRQFADREFGYLERVEATGVSRREFLTLMGASLALAGLTGCRRPVEKIVPYVHQPEEVVSGKNLNYATTFCYGENVIGLVVETQDGRPTKVEGNPAHPGSIGGTNAIAQAQPLGLYDPARSQQIWSGGVSSNWSACIDGLRKLHAAAVSSKGAGLAILSQAYSSPTMARLEAAYRETFPQATWYAYEAVSDENVHAGIAAASNKGLNAVYDFGVAKTILSLDCDFLLAETNNIASTRRFSDGRRVIKHDDSMSRLYMVESAFSTTGGMADHRLAVRHARVAAFAVAVVAKLRDLKVNVADCGSTAATWTAHEQLVLDAVAADLADAGTGALVVAGRRQPAAVHAIAAAINQALQSQAVTYVEAPYRHAPGRQELAALVKALDAGSVNTLIILGGNPVYDAPADLKFAAAMAKAATSVHLGAYSDETARAATWHIPRTHFLEEWGDAAAQNGLLSVVQPMIQPIYSERTKVLSDLELVAIMLYGEETSGHDLVRATWKDLLPGADFEGNWRRVLHDGVLAGSEAKPVANAINGAAAAAFAKATPVAEATGSDLVFLADIKLFDGRFANNGWLQETPDPISKITWDNAALISPSTAEKLGVPKLVRELGSPLRPNISIAVNGVSIIVPTYIVPGMADDTVALALGYGRDGAEQIGPNAAGSGWNAYLLRSSAACDVAAATFAKADGGFELATTQDHSAMEGRPLIRETTHAEYRKGATAYFPAETHYPKAEDDESKPMSIYDHPYDAGVFKTGYQWGMTIDLNTCIGCNACMVACQSENNIPVVGRTRVRQGREMHWIRVDRYFGGNETTRLMAVQPIPCMHCETAPCENVCPVAATVHDKQGLNLMVYNRCIGTRYCSNNCPYKVRRFNYFNFTKDTPQVQQMAANPDVTVRFRGVMEKCSYCLQRINEGKQQAKLENRDVRDGEVKTACMQACPAGAITFGNINDPKSHVSQLKKLDRNYDLLVELDTRPRTSYLAKLRNPNPHPDLELPTPKGEAHGASHAGAGEGAHGASATHHEGEPAAVGAASGEASHHDDHAQGEH